MKLNSWFEIDELEYMQYILEGYTIVAIEEYVGWTLDEKWHRTDGPAVIHRSGQKSYFINGMVQHYLEIYVK